MSSPCAPIPTNACRRWPYQQYYLGEEDEERRRTGQGQNHWSGPESLEWYTGNFVRDMMHGEGDYRWRYQGPEGIFVSYEGQFYANRMHGYGVMSYPDGRVFNGLFYHNMRWGPGIESHACIQENVGLWRGNQLIRLTWRPETPSVTLDLSFKPNTKAIVEPHRTLLTTRVNNIGEVNNAIELLKQCEANPVTASNKWTKLYPKHCTDLSSKVCHVEVFDQEYYTNKIYEIEEVDTMPEPLEDDNSASEDFSNSETYYAWNNNEMMRSLMKHCFKHEQQRSKSGIDLQTILTGQRSQYKSPAEHELDCRTLLMASYLGHVSYVCRLVNENNVHPDVADILGNTALMYATCGDQNDIMHFLVEAGANVNSYNDSCCTPLGLALMKFTCIKKDILPSGMTQALVPPPVIPPILTTLEKTPSEWHITRVLPEPANQLTRTLSKTLAKAGVKKKRSSLIIKSDMPAKPEVKKVKRLSFSKTASPTVIKSEMLTTTIGKLSEEQHLYHDINEEFLIKISDLFYTPNQLNQVPYLFEVCDMVKEVDAEETAGKLVEKTLKKHVSHAIKDFIKPSKDVMWQSSDKEVSSISSAEKGKSETLIRNMSAILQLLKDGADPRLVRCPQSALWIATRSGSADLVRHLVQYGADVNEKNPEAYYCTALDLAVSQPLSYEYLEVAKILLECGAETGHRLMKRDDNDTVIVDEPGPTLLHAVLCKKSTMDFEEEIRRELLQLLLEYNSSPLTQYNGRSAVDMAMTKNLDLFDVFVKNPKTDLNAVINDSNQTVLVKMFSLEFCKTTPVTERLQTLTNLLLYGADPLLECNDEEENYRNIFVFAKNILNEFQTVSTKTANPNNSDTKSKKINDKSVKDTKHPPKSAGKVMGSEDLEDYQQALDLVTECARILHIRWIQAKLLKELIEVVTKYEHRQWNMILPEYKNKKACGLWLSYHRSIEIWDILKNGTVEKVIDRRILKHVLCIVHFNSIRSKTAFKWRLTAEEKGSIETQIFQALRERKIAANTATKWAPWTKPYVTPELTAGTDKKFQVCFDCHLPFSEQKIRCNYCKQISFCSYECMKVNMHRIGCHPCSEYLINEHANSE